ncbi:MAG: glycosyltransferase family 4 protein [Candidatus Omnitrophica bacterium]|nr:glycosyltransferase family 4 protein [Candidatus Omnitrophota bacterium]
MRIAVIGSRGIPATYSGVEKSIEEAIKRLSLKGKEFIVYGHRGNSLSLAAKTNPFPHTLIIETPTLKNKYLATITATFLATVDVLFRKVDIVHYHCLGPSVFSFLPRLFGKKIVVTIHALDWKRKKWPFFAKFFLWLCQFSALYFAHKTIVVSEGMAKKFAPRVIYIPGGVNLAQSRSGSLPDYPGFKKAKFLLFAGRITEEKGIEYLIKAFQEIKSDFQLVIAGEAVYADKYLNYLKNIAGENTFFIGSVKAGTLEALYDQAYLVVFPSEIEGLSLALLEAASFGKCIVASDIAEFKEVLGKAGVYFQKGNYLGLKKELGYLLEHPEVVKERGRETKKIAAGYNWDNIVESLGKVYDQLLQ